MVGDRTRMGEKSCVIWSELRKGRLLSIEEEPTRMARRALYRAVDGRSTHGQRHGLSTISG
jgi:hypothetical protein